METSTVPPRSAIQEMHQVQMLQEPIPVTPVREVIKVVAMGLAITIGQFTILILLLGWAVHR
jgi:hypothetical protein